jgi:GNAT superfamily N-acetyltransferase
MGRSAHRPERMGDRLSLEPRLFVPEEPDGSDRLAILTRLVAFNLHHAEPGPQGVVALLLKDDLGLTIGGLWGTILFAWLHVELLFVPEVMRGTSVGTRLMKRAEQEAVERGCRGVCLDTYSFQARGFYEKLGYDLVGTIGDLPPGGARHYLQKRLV